MTPLVRDLSTHDSWQFAVGSPNFVIRVFSKVPEKGGGIIPPTLSIQSPLSPASLPYEHAYEFLVGLGKAVNYGGLMIRAAQQDPVFYVYGRKFRVRGKEDVFQFLRYLENGDVELFGDGDPEQRFTTIPMNLIPVIEVEDV